MKEEKVIGGSSSRANDRPTDRLAFSSPRYCVVGMYLLLLWVVVGVITAAASNNEIRGVTSSISNFVSIIIIIKSSRRIRVSGGKEALRMGSGGGSGEIFRSLIGFTIHSHYSMAYYPIYVRTAEL